MEKIKVNCLNIITEDELPEGKYPRYSFDQLEMLMERRANVVLVFYRTQAPVLVEVPENVAIEKEFGEYKMNEIRDICALHKKCDRCPFKGYECGFANVMSMDFGDDIASTREPDPDEDDDN